MFETVKINVLSKMYTFWLQLLDLCYEQPQKINDFLIQRLKLKQKQGFKAGIFSKEEISNIFALFYLKREGFIEKQKCKQALKTLANNQFQLEQIEAAGGPTRSTRKALSVFAKKSSESNDSFKKSEPKVSLGNIAARCSICVKHPCPNLRG